MDRQHENIIRFNPIFIHQEEEPNVDEINENSDLIIKDIEFIDKSLIESSFKIKNLLDNTKLKLNSIKNFLNAEKERQEDMNILCNKYTEFTSIINLDKESFKGDLTFEENIISAKLKSYEKLEAEVIDIVGNGYEGNQYVFSNKDFLSNTIDSSRRAAITDNNLATYYEYSRITINSHVDSAPILFNKDSINAECSIELKSDEMINKIFINSDRDDLVLSKVYTSQDGLKYTLDRIYDIAINERYDRYNNQEYIYGSGIIAVEPCNYVKVFLRTNGNTDDTIAFTKTFYNSVGDNSEIIKKVEKVEGAKRHVIKINEISTYKNKYDKGHVISKELITEPVNVIALYCNEYINKNYSLDTNVSYFLIINGEEHEIKPINSHRDGKKIIRTSSQSYKADHVIYINESIKSAKLKVVINSANQDVTPYISNIKVLIGGDIDE